MRIKYIFKNFTPKFLNKLGLLNKFNITSKIWVNNLKLIIPVKNKVGYNNLNLTELWMIDALKRLNYNEGTFIDVGINIGQTLLKVKSVYNDIDYIGFEPNPSCFNYTKELSNVNKFKNTTFIPVGLSNCNTLVELNIFYEDTDSSASIIKEFRPEQKIKNLIIIPVFRLDELEIIKKLTKIAFLKIDVEGAELEVLQGAFETIKKHKPIILIEILPVYKNENTFRLTRQEAIENLLTSIGYKCYRMIKDSKNRLKNFELVNTIGVHSSLESCDYVFTCNDFNVNQI